MKLLKKNKLAFLKHRLKKIFARDLSITKRGFFYFLISFTFSTININFLLVYFIEYQHEELLSPLGLTSILMILLTIVFAGLIVDKFKNRMKLLIISSFLSIIGLFFIIFEYLEILGFSVLIFSTGVYIIDLLTILTHESTILNRGRLLGYFFGFSFLISHFIIIFTFGNLIVILLIECVLFYELICMTKHYSYVETKERMKSDQNLRQIITKKYHIIGYIMAFLTLGFVLSNAFPYTLKFEIDSISFIIIFLLLFIIMGVFLDNIGRKWSFAVGILIISSLIIFAGVFKENAVYISAFFSISIPTTIMLLFTLTGDFSTERNTLKYRGRIAGIFLVFLFIGVFAGITMKYILTQVYLGNQELFYWMPAVITGSSPFLLIVLLIWIMPLPEIFSAKEADWADSLRNLFIFNKSAICLFSKDFVSEKESLNLPNEDLITSGLTGILSLISEITNEKKALRIIDKHRVKIYFSYGKHVICALISTKQLPVLFKKLDIFTKSFEKQFEKELINFHGKINLFYKTGDLIKKYFK